MKFMRYETFQITNGHASRALLAPVKLSRCRESKRRHPQVGEFTGPLELLAGRSLVVVCDAENLSVSGRKAGFKVSFAGLAELLKRTAASVELHAFFSRRAGDTSWEHYFELRGWQAHARDIELIQTCRGLEKLANADNLIAFHAGRLAAQSRAGMDMLIASGDGSLVCDLACALAHSPTQRNVFTLGFPGSTAARLQTSGFIAGNLLLGRDCLRPMPLLRAHGNRRRHV
jgi:hypothetical protein